MPLTGIGVDGQDPDTATRLGNPALAVKVDNAPQAQPQAGIAQADIVIEVMVEGISRYIAVFQSFVPEQVGPVRSARTSDPDLLAMFGKPVFAWSGGNKNVSKVIRSTPWIVNASHDNRSEFYSRDRSRRAPHNLVIRAPELLESAKADGVAPQQIFQYRAPDEAAVGTPTAGFDVSVGSTVGSFRWDSTGGKWVRQAASGARNTEDSEPIAATNVVVLQTEYRRSSADRRSPEAESVGEGTAWVFTGGHIIVGRWSRAARELPWTLTDEAGSPILLAPGNTWVALPESPQTPRLVD